MKTKILISFLLLLLPVSAYSIAWMLQVRWDLSFCEICHDRIYTYIDYAGNQSYTVIPTYSSLIEEHGKESKELYHPAVKLCKRCYEKYAEKYTNMIKDWLIARIKENKPLAEINDKNNQVYKENRIKKQIKDLQKQLEYKENKKDENNN